MNTAGVRNARVLNDAIQVILHIVHIEVIRRRIPLTVFTVGVGIQRIDRAPIRIEEEQS